MEEQLKANKENPEKFWENLALSGKTFTSSDIHMIYNLNLVWLGFLVVRFAAGDGIKHTWVKLPTSPPPLCLKLLQLC